MIRKMLAMMITTSKWENLVVVVVTILMGTMIKMVVLIESVTTLRLMTVTTTAESSDQIAEMTRNHLMMADVTGTIPRMTTRTKIGATDSDTTIGGYAGGGFDFDLFSAAYAGVGARVVFGHEPTLAGIEAKADYPQFFLRLGWAF